MASVWSQAESNGRTYYYNTITKATQWTKPEELMTPSEVRYQHPLLFDQRLTDMAARSRESTMETTY